jgi:hypothetical protein
LSLVKNWMEGRGANKDVRAYGHTGQRQRSNNAGVQGVIWGRHAQGSGTEKNEY